MSVMLENGEDDSEAPSLECIDLPSLAATLFPPLCGETTVHHGKCLDGVIALSNYRLVIRYSNNSYVNVPLGLIDAVEIKDMTNCQMFIFAKDGRSFRCLFGQLLKDQCLEWQNHIVAATSPRAKTEDYFAFAFYNWCTEKADLDSLPLAQEMPYDFYIEYERMGFNKYQSNTWRICELNSSYRLCSSYPKYHIIPSCINDADLESVAAFRALHRIPSVVWRHQYNGAVICRCSQPEVGWLGWRSTQDENLLKAIARACAADSPNDKSVGRLCNGPMANGDLSNGNLSNGDVGNVEDNTKKLLILDARSYTAAVANRAKGGGCECADYYSNCEIQFMSLANIHAIRKSFLALRQLCASPSDQASWLSSLENTKWLHNISALMKSALVIVNAVDREVRPVLVHCSDGWDRTPQIVALAELMLDPHYRRMEGFQTLVEREWLEFGHKFADRCGHSTTSDDQNERCPVFLQWLDCVHQLLLQFPCAFEFNEAYLVKLLQHVYSCLFGTFLCNTSSERHELRLKKRSFSVWSFLRSRRSRFRNLLYTETEQVLLPSCNIQNMSFWSMAYLPDTVSAVEDKCEPVANVDTQVAAGITKTRSCDDIVAALEHTSALPRTSSDPNLVDTHRAFVEEQHSTPCKSACAALLTTVVSDVIENGPSGNGDCNCENAGVLNGTSDIVENGIENNGNVHAIAGDSDVPVTNCASDKTLCNEPSIESSTDTIVPENVVTTACTKLTELQNGDSNLLKECSNCAVSTSLVERKKLGLKVYPDLSTFAVSNHDQYIPCMSGKLNGMHSRTAHTSGSSTLSNDSSPHQFPMTPGSSYPASPTMVPLDPVLHRSMSGLIRTLDYDGLPIVKDSVQQRLRQMESEYLNKIEHLQHDLQAARLLIKSMHRHGTPGSCHSHDGSEDLGSIPDSTGSGEHPPLGGTASSFGSDFSYEMVEDEDAEVTRWMPDHSVSDCQGCHSRFGLITRRHHCRSCGRIFCSTCSSNRLPVPKEQLIEPVRVCNTCSQYLDLPLSQSCTHLDVETAITVTGS